MLAEKLVSIGRKTRRVVASYFSPVGAAIWARESILRTKRRASTGNSVEARTEVRHLTTRRKYQESTGLSMEAHSYAGDSRGKVGRTL